MKKAAFILALAILLCLGVNAEEFTSASTTVFYSAPSQYCILIPEIVNVDGGSFTFSATEMDLRSDERVEISVSGIDPDGSIQMFTESGRWMLAKMFSSSGEVTCGSTISRFYNGMTESSESFYITAIETEGAGEYYGTMQFNISLVKD